MKALIATGQREAAVAFADISMPELKPGESLVKVEAFSVNRGAGTCRWHWTGSRTGER